MTNIIIAFHSEKNRNNIYSLVKSNGFSVNNTCISASNLRQCCGYLNNAIVICGCKFMDENIYTVIEDLHLNFTFIVVDNSNNLSNLDNNKCSKLALPIKHTELLNTLNLALYQNDEKLKAINKKLLIDTKSLLSKTLNMSESDAHKYIQKKSMDERTSMNEICNNILSEYSL